MRQQRPLGLFNPRPAHLEEGFGAEQVIQQRAQERGAALILVGAYLKAVKDFRRMSELLERLFRKPAGFRQRPQLPEHCRAGVVRQWRDSDEMITGENVGRDRGSGRGG